ncbi:MAG: ABC transporter ATP-binding protein, partial [Gammaproteobacteria bacterium]
MLSVSGLTISRGERVLVRDLTFGLSSGEVVALTGANGTGKTSLLRALAGFLRPDAGTVAYEGVELSEARRRHLHWQGPLDGLKSARRAGDELTFQARYAGANADGIAA